LGTGKEKRMEQGSLVLEDGTVLPPDPAEQALRGLYAIGEDSVRLSLIRAADGSAVGPDGSSRSLNGPEDLRILRVTRSLADIVIVGAQTARAERYGDIRLRPELAAAREGTPVHLAIVTRSGELPEGLTPSLTWILTTESGRANVPAAWSERVVEVGRESPDPGRVVRALRERGYERLLCEGGPRLATWLMDHGVVTDYCLTTSPLPPGAGATVPAVPEGAALLHTLRGGGFTMNRWSLS
jgi:riboflavin biosynthesis pyrimidine reductase